MLRVALAFVLLLGLACHALAQTADDDEAHSLYEAGRTAFESGRFDRALDDFQRAYDLSHRAGLLYNIGQAADRLRHDSEALDAFERYLASDQVDDALRPQIESRVEVLRASVASTSVAPAPELPAPASPLPPPRSYDPTPGIALTITGGVVAVAGIVMLAIAASANSSVQNAPARSAWADQSSNLDLANGLGIGGGVGVGVGVVLGVIGAVLWATTPSALPSASLQLGPGSLTLRGTF